MKVADKSEILALFKVSLAIAVLIFFTSILYDLAVKVFYGSTNPIERIFSSLVAIALMTLAIAFLLWWIPDTRKAILRMFGLDEEKKQEAT